MSSNPDPSFAELLRKVSLPPYLNSSSEMRAMFLAEGFLQELLTTIKTGSDRRGTLP